MGCNTYTPPDDKRSSVQTQQSGVAGHYRGVVTN
jgi:hypothetical protein